MSSSLRRRLLPFVLAAVVSTLVSVSSAHAVVDEGNRGFRSGASFGEEPRADEPTRGERAVKFALQVVGTPYRWAGESPGSGFDCSGLVRWAYGRVGVDLPHSSYALYDVGRRVAPSRVAPGDLLFFEGLGHVGIYVGRGRMVHAPQSGRNVEVVQLDGAGYSTRLVGVRRVAAS